MQNKDLKTNIKKGKNKLREKMKKWQIKNSEKLEILEISEKLFRVFFFLSFRFFPTAKLKNLDLKISKKKISEISEFSTWPKKILISTNYG